jgi:hypothetical protein
MVPMRFPTNSARATPLEPLVLLIGSGIRVDYMRTKLRRLGGSIASAESLSDAGSLLRKCSGFDAVVISADLPERGWAIAQDLRRALRCASPVWIVSDKSPGWPLRQEARASRVQFCPRKQGLPALLDSLIRRTFDNLVGLVVVAWELLQSDALVTLFFEC